jgi:hypothetical protein
MADHVRARERETEAEVSKTRLYEPKIYEHAIAELDRSMHGRVVIRGDDIPYDMHKQANSKRYMSPLEPELQDQCLHDWEVFLQVFPEKSGKHRHQGGLVIFVVEGHGYTVIDGTRHDWEAGDLMLLPMTPGGLEHQHFNEDKERPAKWIAFIYWPYFNYGGSEITQIESCPLYDEWMAKVEAQKKQFEPTNRSNA